MSYLSLPTSLPYVRDSVNARSITPVNPTRWFLVPDSTPCSELKTSAVRRGETYPKEAAVILQYCMTIGLLPQSGFLLARNAPGRRETISGLSPQTLLYKVIHLRLSLGLIRAVFLFTASSSPPIIYRQISMERLFRRMTDTQKPTEDEMRSKENA